MNHEKNSNPEWTDAAIEVELAAISPLTIQAFNKDTFTVSSFQKSLCEYPKIGELYEFSPGEADWFK